MKKSASVIAAVLCLLLLGGCAGKNTGAEIPEITSTVSRDTKFNSATVSISPEDFEKAGFRLGDSCDIEFENGFSMTDVPYYNGYYVKNGAPIIVAYPGYENVAITYNNCGIWDTAKLSEQTSVTIRLHEAGRYSAVQDSLGQVYSFKPEDYGSIEEFCNFRALSGGELKENLLFRGASPVDSSRGRAPYTDELLKTAGISLVIDLSDSEADIACYLADDGFNSPYAKELYERGQVVLLEMDSAYQSEAYCERVAAGMKELLRSSGPVYIHCMEGKDRTGFVCMLLEALAGADYEEMRRDYMTTYNNYFSVSADGTPEKYAAISELYFDPFVIFLHGTEDMEVLKSADYTQDAAAYLISGGMTAGEVEQLRELITK